MLLLICRDSSIRHDEIKVCCVVVLMILWRISCIIEDRLIILQTLQCLNQVREETMNDRVAQISFSLWGSWSRAQAGVKVWASSGSDAALLDIIWPNIDVSWHEK